MNENLNLVEILKDCPRGTKLYSIMWGEVELEKLNVDRTYPIVVKTKTKQSNIEDLATFTSSGMWSSEYNGECMLFPSKDQRDWSKFNDGIKAADAEHNLESLWYNTSIRPKDNSEILVNWNIKGHSGYESYYICGIENWDRFIERYGISKWTYISDLLTKVGRK